MVCLEKGAECEYKVSGLRFAMRIRSLFEPKASLNGFAAHSQPVADPSLIVYPLLTQAVFI